mmetsp:Transcript_80611/g.184683  ORF Transcript_80611/g.184683 Transcript_80611/m.184683 type:complete len:233 (-) Transcript_80611:104-802(-)
MSLLRTRARGIVASCRRGIEEFWKGAYMDPTVGAKQKHLNAVTGDPWPAALLRLKSFEDLHKLWYVCLKEKNLLMTERNYFQQHNVPWKQYGRTKKIKLTMKRILTVLTRREIHQQILKAQEIAEKQNVREELETRRFHLEEGIKQLEHKVERMGNAESVMKSAWRATLAKYRTDHDELMGELKDLRKDTMQYLVPDWRYERKYSDLPGLITFRRQWVRALQEKSRRPIRTY